MTTHQPIYVQPPALLNMSSEILLQVEKPFYDIPEAGLHWYCTYHSHHREKLSLVPTIQDSCFLFTSAATSNSPSDTSLPRGLTCLQTDDTGSCGNSAFIATESKMVSSLECKPTEILSDGMYISFNDAYISISQDDQSGRLQEVTPDEANKEEFVAQRARGSYIAAVARSYLTFGVFVASQILIPDFGAVRDLNEHIKNAKNNSNRALKFVPIDKNCIRLAAFCDAIFYSNCDLTSQLGFLIALADENGKSNILQF